MTSKLWIVELCCAAGLTFALQAQTQSATSHTVTTPGGTVNVVPKYSGSATIVNSTIFENGGKVGIGTTAPSAALTVNGGITSSGKNIFDNAIRLYKGSFDGIKNYADFRTVSGDLVIDAAGGKIVFNHDHGNGVFFANGNGQYVGEISGSVTGNSWFLGNLGIGTNTPSSRLTVKGEIQSTSGGFKFPDNTIQQSAGLSSVIHNSTLAGQGTANSPLHVAVPLMLSSSSSSPPLTLNNSAFGTALDVSTGNVSIDEGTLSVNSAGGPWGIDKHFRKL